MKRIDLPDNLKIRFLELGTKIVRDEYFRRLKIALETRLNLEGLPELLEYIDYKYPAPSADFEERLNKFVERFKNVKL